MDKEELIEAARKLAENCSKMNYCMDCPLYEPLLVDEGCLLSGTPMLWEI